MIKIGIDAMGGDFAPEVAVEGAVMALQKIDKESRVVLFGDEKRIRELLAKHHCAAENFDIVPTTQVIEMGDHPAKAFVSKSDSSITVGFNYLAEGKIDGFASAGSTGAMLVGSTMVIKPVEGVIRPVISSLIPKLINRRGLILDVGLNVDAKPEVLAQYALLGSIYAQSVMGIENPRVALLNIGEEDTKGNAQAKATFELLKADKRINFVGNVESSYIFTGTYGGPDPDVVVTDGFVGNTVLKMAEALYRINFKLGGGKPRLMNFLRPVLGRIIPKLYYQQDFWEQMNYESIGGTPVIGINAPVMIGHGSSSARAISSMILSMEREIKGKFPEKLRAALAEK
ncbi:MAG: phosphate acyltransferase PlsX [Alistipes sp.]|nr:phosphate acyltransferase PlsX [Alistipes sp.]MBQ5620501.1 phosphate acyltransferase PlsX [Alistipes sp.]MBQ5903060.1 phosphate acyltransferase PlsX [Alistipes sp.]